MEKYLLIVLITLMLISCAGSDSNDSDSIPPEKPFLYPHLGDTGDGEVLNPFSNQMIQPNDNNNGIDAVPDGNWIRLMWDWEFQNDIDLSGINIHRYRMDNSGIIDLRHIASIESENFQYIDMTLDNSPGQAISTTWYYFIEVLDQSGNSTLSDTVSYKLSFKPLLDSPANEAILQADQSIIFSWEPIGLPLFYRVIVFDEDHNYLWKYDEYQTEESEFSIVADFFFTVGNSYIWRVDAFENLVEPSGSESVERTFTISN
ncbi:MAG: hypothetical protein PHR06_10410 [Candidatus Cloacimonetes bacterium]|nr:hypothetical protein [Candidatus Cloacimonadota bacterium]